MTPLLDQAKNLVVFDGNLTIHVFSTLVVRFGKHWAQDLSTSLSDYDFGTNGFNESQTSFMEVNEFLTVLSTLFPIYIDSIFSSVYRFLENR
jgi:hypothetical protein